MGEGHDSQTLTLEKSNTNSAHVVMGELSANVHTGLILVLYLQETRSTRIVKVCSTYRKHNTYPKYEKVYCTCGTVYSTYRKCSTAIASEIQSIFFYQPPHSPPTLGT